MLVLIEAAEKKKKKSYKGPYSMKQQQEGML